MSDFPSREVVGQAQDAPGAQDLIQKLRPEVVILDLRMPGGGGYRVLEAVRTECLYHPLVNILINYPFPRYPPNAWKPGTPIF